jgi:hypothetical protein
MSDKKIEEEIGQLLTRADGIDDTTREILLRHNGFGLGPKEKLEDIAKDFGVTKEAVRQRSIKGVERISDRLSYGSPDEEVVTLSKLCTFLAKIAPCTESDMQNVLYMQEWTDKKDIDIEALTHMLDELKFDHKLAVVKEGSKDAETRFLVLDNARHVIRSLIKRAREEVTAHGACNIPYLAKEVATGHTHPSNQLRCLVAALESQKDFVWLTDEVNDEFTRQPIGFFLLKDAGRNPVELRLKRIFSVRVKSNQKWMHKKYVRSRKAMKSDVAIPPEAIARIGVEKGICKPAAEEGVYERAMHLDPKKVLSDFEYKIWDFLRKHPGSKDSEIMDACKRRETDRFNIRSKLNFSVVIQRVSHGIYSAVTDDFPKLADTTVVGVGKSPTKKTEAVKAASA